MQRAAHDTRSWSGLRLVAAVGLASGLSVSCLDQVVDLRRVRSTGDPEPVCGWRERVDPLTGACASCVVLPVPSETCLCAWASQAAPFPYCDSPDAYYECLPCAGGLDACNDFTAGMIADALGATRDCARLSQCCADSAAHDPAGSCCPCGDVLECVLVPDADPERNLFAVRCQPDPGCGGTACPNGSIDCQSWQQCVAGACAPVCPPGQELTCGCVCQDVPNPP